MAQAPYSVWLSPDGIAENMPAGSLVGLLSTSDPDVGDTFTYSLVPGTGSSDNDKFQIVGNELRTAVSFDAESSLSRAVRVRSTDSAGLYMEQYIAVFIQPVSEFAPTDIALHDNQSVAPGQAAGGLVAPIMALDGDVAEQLTYSLVPGDGDTDNALFAVGRSLNGTQLRLAADVTRPAGSTYSLRLRVSDTGGLWYEEPFTIRVRGLGTVYSVNSLADIVSDDGVLTLREAVDAASNNVAVADAPAGSPVDTDRITFDLPALQAQAGDGVIPRIVLNMAGTPLRIGGHTEIVGPGADGLIIDANHNGRVMEMSGSHVAIRGLTITGGSAANGAGLQHWMGTLQLDQVHVTGNTATGFGGGVQSGDGDLILQNSIVSENLASGSSFSEGAGISGYGSRMVIRDSIIRDNQAISSGSGAQGAGISAFNGSVVILNTTILRNRITSTSYGAGAGIRIGDSSLDMVNSALLGNVISSAASSGFATGGGVHAHRSRASLVNVAAVGNAALAPDGFAMGGGILVDDQTQTQPVALTATNVTVSANVAAGRDFGSSLGGGIVAMPSTMVQLYNGIIAMNSGGNASNLLGVHRGNYTDLEASFVRNPSPGADATWGTSDDDYGDLRPAATSWSINTGYNGAPDLAGVTTDLAGRPRISGGIVDRGAYERDVEAPTVASVLINNGAAQRSMVRQITITFSEPVAMDPGSIRILTGTGLPLAVVTVAANNPSEDKRTYVLTFSGPGAIGGSLPDGVYDLSIVAPDVRDFEDNFLSGNYTQRFHRLFGDSNGDGRVNLVDYRAMRSTLGKSSGQGLFNEALDYDGGGVVNVMDLGMFRRRFGARVL